MCSEMLKLVQHFRTGESFFSKKREKYLKQMSFCYILMELAEMVELVDTRDLKSLVS